MRQSEQVAEFCHATYRSSLLVAQALAPHVPNAAPLDQKALLVAGVERALLDAIVVRDHLAGTAGRRPLPARVSCADAPAARRLADAPDWALAVGFLRDYGRRQAALIARLHEGVSPVARDLRLVEWLAENTREVRRRAGAVPAVPSDLVLRVRPQDLAQTSTGAASTGISGSVHPLPWVSVRPATWRRLPPAGGRVPPPSRLSALAGLAEAAIGMVRHEGLPLGLGAELAGFASEVVDLVAAAGTAPEDPAAHPDEELSVRWAALNAATGSAARMRSVLDLLGWVIGGAGGLDAAGVSAVGISGLERRYDSWRARFEPMTPLR